MQVDYIEETTVRKALAFEIEPEVIQAEIDRAAKQLAKKARLPGFRPGKIPTDVVKRRFQEDILSETAEVIVNKYVFKEMDERGLKPLAQPRVEDLSIAEGKPMTFRAVFETLPEVEVPDWKGLRVSVKGADEGDEEIDKEIDRLREQAARYDPVDPRPSEKGDHVTIDLTWTPRDGSAGGRDENALIEIGHEGNHEDMNAALEGMAIDETKDVDVTWGPEAAPAIAGKTVGYSMTLKGIKKKVVPEADDEFAKDLGEFDSLEALKGKHPGAAQDPGGAPRRARDAVGPRRGARRQGLLRGSRDPGRAPHDRADREPGPRAGLPGSRPPQGRHQLEANTASRSGRTR